MLLAGNTSERRARVQAIIGPIIAIQWGWLPALIWILGGAFFIGWVHDYSSAVIAMRNEGASFGANLPRLVILAAWGVITFVLALRYFRWQ